MQFLEWRYDTRLDRDWLILLKPWELHEESQSEVVETWELKQERLKDKLMLATLIRSPSAAALIHLTSIHGWQEVGDYYRNGKHTTDPACYGELIMDWALGANRKPDPPFDTELLGERLSAWSALDLGHVNNVTLREVWGNRPDQYLHWLDSLRSGLDINPNAKRS